MKDISPNWPGLSIDILYDIYGVHKALIFSRLQRKDFTAEDFMDCIKKAEETTFKEAICSPELSKQKYTFPLSFYPEYLINDDIFEVMACHFAVSAVVNSMRTENDDIGQLRILSVVIPSSISSRYDVDAEFESMINGMDQLAQMGSSRPGVHYAFECHLENVIQIADVLRKMISQFNYDGVISNNLVIVFNRRRSADQNAPIICVFGCDEWSKMRQLHQNYFLSFDFPRERCIVRWY